MPYMLLLKLEQQPHHSEQEERAIAGQDTNDLSSRLTSLTTRED